MLKREVCPHFIKEMHKTFLIVCLALCYISIFTLAVKERHKGEGKAGIY